MNNHLVTMTIDHVSFNLREFHDFSWLSQLGTVFCVFDQQDSGNIAFGVKKDNQKLFIKYAGAKTMCYNGHPADAISILKNTISIYEDLKHPILIELLNHFELDCGYALVFKWADGESLHAHWTFNQYNKYTHPKSAYYQFKQLPIKHRLKCLDDIFSFHQHVEENDYLAVDCYDGSIMYDFHNHITTLCDIDFYQKKPLHNELGSAYWGSPRFKAPEEFELGAYIDAQTNVYTMGALAFGLLGGETDHCIEKWEASEELYDIAKKATEPNRHKRYESVAAFYNHWKANTSCK